MAMSVNGIFRPGLKTTEWLHAVGITELSQVAHLGVMNVCRIVAQAGFPVSLNLAYGLQAELMGLTWNHLPAEIRERISAEYAQAVAETPHKRTPQTKGPGRTRRAKPRRP